MNEIVTARDAEAIAYARGVIQRMQRDEIEFDGLRLNWLEKRDNRRYVIEVIKYLARWSPERLMDMVDAARSGWGVADEALRELMLDYLNKGEVMPTYLAAYSMEVVGKRTPRQRGKQKADYFLRDMAILSAIVLVIDKFQLAPTSRDGKHTCACGIVADALVAAHMGIGYKAVAEIWRKYGRIALPGRAG